MKELFNVREANSKKIVAGPFSDKQTAKLKRNELDPDALIEHDSGKRSRLFKFVVTKGKDHINFGVKYTKKTSSRKRKK
jgi:hypothetical protein